MEREKMIKELANAIAFIFVEKMTSNGIRYETIAEMLLDMGYRKVPEGSVVLTREELEQRNKEIKELKIANNNLIFQLQCHDDEVQRLMKENGKLRFERDYSRKAVRKETAREILLTLKGLIKEPWQSYDLAIDDLQRIAEKYGVEDEE